MSVSAAEIQQKLLAATEGKKKRISKWSDHEGTWKFKLNCNQIHMAWHIFYWLKMSRGLTKCQFYFILVSYFSLEWAPPPECCGVYLCWLLRLGPLGKGQKLKEEEEECLFYFPDPGWPAQPSLKEIVILWGPILDLGGQGWKGTHSSSVWLDWAEHLSIAGGLVTKSHLTSHGGR